MSVRVMAATSLVFALVCASAPTLARRTTDPPRPTIHTPGHRLAAPADVSPSPRARAAYDAPDSLVLGAWGFDDGTSPDPQGWVTVDRTAQADTFFHIDDFAGLGGLLAPLSGQRSLWCGARSVSGWWGPYESLPGYGDLWDQRFESRAFGATGAVTVDFLVRYDSEPTYDYTRLEYRSKTGAWRSLLEFNGTGELFATATVPADSLAGSVRLRFRFVSDGSFSDEDGTLDTDGAVIIDSLTVRDAGGVLDFQDFEAEAAGTQATADGDWTATVRPAYGDFAALFDGAAVLQEDPNVTNATHLWGFFNGSTVNYACGGHPEQSAVPYMESIDGIDVGLCNWVVSPVMSVTEDVNGSPVVDPTRITLEFDVYRDLPLDNMVFYTFHVRSLTDGVAGPWRSTNYVYYSLGSPAWYRFRRNVLDLIEPGATHIQVALEAVDLCPEYCGSMGSGTCHSHAPLFDNVRVVADHGFATFVVSNTDDSGAGSLRQAIEDANSYRPARIAFDIAGTGPHTIYLLDWLPILGADVMIDGTTQPGYAGTPLIRLSGAYSYNVGLRTGGDGCELYGLELTGFSGTGSAIWLSSDGNTVQACTISASGTGVRVEGDGNVIGGTGPGAGNVLAGNGTGVLIKSGTGNTVRGNSVTNSTGLGLDLWPTGLTPNDAQDADTGANDLLNFPVLYYVVFGTPGWVGGYVTGPAGESYTIDFYASTACDASGNGEGAIYLGSATVTAAPGYRNSWFHASLASVPDGHVITATATDASGSTSEFSACNSASGFVNVVTNTNDAGGGSLRSALTLAQITTPTVIRFNIPGAGPHVIQPLTALPALTRTTFIDGYSQPGAYPNGNPPDQPVDAVIKIELDGTVLGAGTAKHGLQVLGDNCTIRGLAIGGFGARGIYVNAADGVTVAGNFIGTDASGLVDRGNTGDGVHIYNGVGNVIGGGSPADRNVVSGNTGIGVSANSDLASSNLICGNFVGLDATGEAVLPNVGGGVFILGAPDNVVGGSTPASRNVISGNTAYGVRVSGLLGRNARIEGNRIGTDLTGTLPRGNAQGVGLYNAPDAVIRGNVIAASLSGPGISLQDTETRGAIVRDNIIGMDATATGPMGNKSGILVHAAHDNTIGGTAAGEPNIIAHSELYGVGINIGSGNRVSGNAIFANGGLAIDLDTDGVTANDAGDADTGPNNLQNFPVLDGAVVQPGGAQVSGTLASTPGTQFRVEFFANAACDAEGYGEAGAYLGQATVTTDGTGVASFAETLPNVPAGSFVSATATDPSGNTSEFSACVEAINTPAGTAVTIAPVDPVSGTAPATVTFDQVTGGGNTTLVTGPSGPPLPGSFLAGNDTYYDLSTTASFTGEVEVCIAYSETNLLVPESGLRILHYDAGIPGWVDVTSSLDTGANIVCGVVTSLSPFVLGTGSLTGIVPAPDIPDRFALRANVPNPFNPTTTIAYDVPAGGADVGIVIYDVAGRRVRTLVNEHRAPGRYRAVWDGRTDRGTPVASGVYFYRMTAGSFAEARKMVLLK